MQIKSVSRFIEGRAMRAMSSPQIRMLVEAVNRALSAGDLEAAAAFQRMADALRLELTREGLALAAPPRAPTQEEAKKTKKRTLDAQQIAFQWRSLGASQVHTSGDLCVLDCGSRGAIAITPDGVSISGTLVNEPLAHLLLARHTQIHWDGRSRLAGSPEFKFQAAVASKMLGVSAGRARHHLLRRSAVAEKVAEWQPILDSIIGPTRPTSRRSGAPAVELTGS